LPDDEVVSQGESAFAATSARLSLLDEPLHPRTLAQLLVACIDAAVEEAKARARGSGATHEVTAEELTPLVIFVASRSRWRRPHALLAFVSAYAELESRASYLVTVAASCVAWICERGPAGAAYADLMGEDAVGGTTSEEYIKELAQLKSEVKAGDTIEGALEFGVH